MTRQVDEQLGQQRIERAAALFAQPRDALGVGERGAVRSVRA
jgi:hypothetical protein